jgi:hypothetical protein
VCHIIDGCTFAYLHVLPDQRSNSEQCGEQSSEGTRMCIANRVTYYYYHYHLHKFKFAPGVGPFAYSDTHLVVGLKHLQASHIGCDWHTSSLEDLTSPSSP